MNYQPIQFHPFITYDPSHQSFVLHSETIISRKNSLHFLSLIEVQQKDHRLFKVSQQNKTHGLFISDPIIQANSGKQVIYALLPTNEAKISDKYQDLLAQIALMISNVCIFDISSKYLRQTKNYQDNSIQRMSYVVMNSHSNGSSIYKANLTFQNTNTKMEISTKLQGEYQSIMKVLTQNIRTSHEGGLLYKNIQKTMQRQIIYKNFLSFEQLQMRLVAQMKIMAYLKELPEYICIYKQKRKLNRRRFEQLKDKVIQFQSQEFLSYQQRQIFASTKREIIDQIYRQNQQYSYQFLHQLRSQYLGEGELTIEELRKRQEQVMVQLTEHGLETQLASVVCSKKIQQILRNKIQSLEESLRDQQKDMSSLSSQLCSAKHQLSQNIQTINNYKQKCYDVRQINQKYDEVCKAYERQKQGTIKNRIQIQTLLIQQERSKYTQRTLINTLKQFEEEKINLQNLISCLRTNLKQKDQEIEQKKNRLEDLDKKIKNIESLEAQVWRHSEESKFSRAELERYKNLCASFESHIQTFKKAEVQKFNYILKKNGQAHISLKRELQQKQAIIQDLRSRLQRSALQLKEEKIRVKFIQSQGWSQHKKRHLQNQTTIESLKQEALPQKNLIFS